MTTTVAQLAVDISANTAGLQRGLNQANSQITGAFSGIGRELTKVIGAFGAASLGQQIVSTAIAWEDAFANVSKTVEGTPAELSDLERRLREMATSDIVGGLENAHMQLANIASLGGQLGISTDALDEFTETIAGMTVATNLSAEEAANFAARFSNVAGLDVANDIGKLGDTVVTLGNNLATSESEVAAFGLRLAGLANQGFDPQEVLAYGGALSSLGVTAELGSTNLIKSVNDMISAVSEGGEELDIMAGIAGMTAEEFSALAGQDTEKAFRNLVTGLRGLDSASRLEKFRELGITGIEQQRVLSALADGYDTLGLALQLAGEGWEENGALMEEAMRKAETTQGGLNRLGNAMTNLGVEIGMRVLPGLGDMVEGLTDIVQGNFEGGLRGVATGFSSIIDSFAGTDLTGGVNAFFDAMSMLPAVLDKLGISDSVKTGIDTIGRIPEVIDKLGVGENIQAGLDALARIPEVINLLNIPEGFDAFVSAMGRIPELIDKLGVGENIQAGLSALVRIPEVINLLNIPEGFDAFLSTMKRIPEVLDALGVGKNIQAGLDALARIPEVMDGLGVGENIQAGLDALARIPGLIEALPGAGAKIKNTFKDMVTDLGNIANNVTAWAEANGPLAVGLGGLTLALYLNQGALMALPAALAGTRIGMALTTGVTWLLQGAQAAYNLVASVGAGIIGGLNIAMGLATGTAGGLAGALMAVVGPVAAVGLAVAGVVWQLDQFNKTIDAPRTEAQTIVQEQIVSGELTREELDQRSFDAIAENFGGGVVGDTMARLFYSNLSDTLQGDAQFQEPIAVDVAIAPNPVVDNSAAAQWTQPIADQIVQSLSNQVLTGDIDPNAIANGAMQSFGRGAVGIENFIEFASPEATAAALGEEGKQVVTDALTLAFSQGDEGALEVLTPLANVLEIDIAQIQADLQAQMAAQEYPVTVTAAVTVLPGSVDMSAVNGAMGAGYGSGSTVNVTLNTYGTNPRQTADQLETAASDRGRGGNGRR